MPSEKEAAFDPKTNTVYLNRRNPNMSRNEFLAQKTMHELGHAIAETSQYSGIRETLLKNSYKDDAELERAIADKITQYETAGIALTYDDAMEEITSEELRKALADPARIEQLLNNDAKFGNTLLQKIKDILWQIKKMFTKGGKNSEGYKNYQIAKELEQMYRNVYDAVRNIETREDALQAASVEEDINSDVNNRTKYSLDEYSEQEKNNWKDSKKIFIAENEQQLQSFIDEALNDRNSHKKLYFGKISPLLAQKIYAETGINVDGYNCTIRADEVRKTFNSHGNEYIENKRGQRVMTSEDIKSIPEVIESADKIWSDSEYKGMPTISFRRSGNGWTEIVTYVVDGNHDLRVQTIYGGKIKEDLSTLADTKVPRQTSLTGNGMVFNNEIIENQNDDVNPQTLSDYLSEENRGNRRIQKKFSVEDPIEETKNLIAIHNLNAGNMRSTINNGGKIPMGSIAVTTSELSHEDYGDISVVFGKETIDPNAKKGNRVYGADVWTPLYPKEEVKVTEETKHDFNEKIYKPLYQKYGRDMTDALYELARYPQDIINDNEDGLNGIKYKIKQDENLKRVFLAENGYNAAEKTTTQTEKHISEKGLREAQAVINLIGEETLKNEDHIDVAFTSKYKENLMSIYAEMNGKEPSGLIGFTLNNMVRRAKQYIENGGVEIITEEHYAMPAEEANRLAKEKGYDKWVDEITDNLIAKTGLRNNVAELTENGRRSWEALHKKNTPENALDIMRGQEERRVSEVYGMPPVAKLITNSAKTYTDLESIQNDRGRIYEQKSEQREADIENLNQKLYDIAKTLKGSNTNIDTRANALAEAVYYENTEEDYQKYVKENYDLTLSNNQARQLSELKNEASELPTKYFEAKPDRIINTYKEASFIELPQGKYPDIEQAFNKQGIPVITYDESKPGDRKTKMNEAAEKLGLKFSVELEAEAEKLTRKVNNEAKEKLEAAREKGRTISEEEAALNNDFADFMKNLAEDYARKNRLNATQKQIAEKFAKGELAPSEIKYMLPYLVEYADMLSEKFQAEEKAKAYDEKQNKNTAEQAYNRAIEEQKRAESEIDPSNPFVRAFNNIIEHNDIKTEETAGENNNTSFADKEAKNRKSGYAKQFEINENSKAGINKGEVTLSNYHLFCWTSYATGYKFVVKSYG